METNKKATAYVRVNSNNQEQQTTENENGSANGPYQELYDRPLTKTREAEINFNLVNFVATLVKMDRQHKDWLVKIKKH